MSDPVSGLLSAQQPTPKKREFPGFKLALRFSGDKLSVNTEIRYGKAEVEPLLDVEGELEKVGPQGKPVTSKWEKKYFEDGVEIPESAIRRLQILSDGAKVEVEELDRTTVVDIKEGRSIEECSLDGETSYGTTITRESVDQYAPESTYESWGSEALRTLAEYLEKERVSLFYPFTFGRGYKVYTVTAYSLRENGTFFFVIVMNAGRRILKHMIVPTPSAAQEKPKPILAKPILRRKPAVGVN